MLWSTCGTIVAQWHLWPDTGWKQFGHIGIGEMEELANASHDVGKLPPGAGKSHH